MVLKDDRLPMMVDQIELRLREPTMRTVGLETAVWEVLASFLDCTLGALRHVCVCDSGDDVRRLHHGQVPPCEVAAVRLGAR